jgi:hypothetical protein
MGPASIVVPDHFGNMNLILQNCSDVDLNIPRGALIGHIVNSAQNEHKLTTKQILDPAKMEKIFNARNKPLPNPWALIRMSSMSLCQID